MATVSVKFSDDDGNAEGTVDTGGLRREFFRLLLHAANEKADIFQGLLYWRVMFPNSSGELKEGAEREKSGESEEDEGKLTLTPKNFQLKKRREKLEKSTAAKKTRRKWKEDDTKVTKKRFECQGVTPFRSEVGGGAQRGRVHLAPGGSLCPLFLLPAEEQEKPARKKGALVPV